MWSEDDGKTSKREGRRWTLDAGKDLSMVRHVGEGGLGLGSIGVRGAGDDRKGRRQRSRLCRVLRCFLGDWKINPREIKLADKGC